MKRIFGLTVTAAMLTLLLVGCGGGGGGTVNPPILPLLLHLPVPQSILEMQSTIKL